MNFPVYTFTRILQFDGEEVKVDASYYLMPRGTDGSLAPEFDLFYVSYKMEKTSNGQRLFPRETPLYVHVFVKDDYSSIGEVVNQRPAPYTHMFFLDLKEAVLEEYRKVHAQLEERLKKEGL